MDTNEVLQLLTTFSKRLATLADQALETRQQAQHTHDRILLLCEHIEELRRRIVMESVTDMDGSTLAESLR
jgi:hypothetical protein